MYPRKTKKINQELTQKRAVRVRMLLKQNGMLQATLAERIGYTPQHFSAMLNGRKTFSVDVAKRIAREFPPIRFQWIMAEDDFETENAVLLFAKRQKFDMYSGVESLLSGCGINLVLSGNNDKSLLSLVEYLENDERPLNIGMFPNECVFSFNSEMLEANVGEFSTQEIIEVFEDIADYAVFKVQKLIARAKSGNGAEVST